MIGKTDNQTEIKTFYIGWILDTPVSAFLSIKFQKVLSPSKIKSNQAFRQVNFLKENLYHKLDFY